LTDVDIPLDTGDFRLMTRRALDAFLSLPEQARFIRGMVAWVGFRQVPILYDRAERHAGETNYPLRKMLRLAVDAITGFSTAPLRFASHVGLWLVAASILLVGYIGVGFFTGSSVPGWTSLMLVVVILGAVQMFVLGMIGEYLGRVYVEAKRRPLYIVAEIAGQAGGRPQLGHVAEPAAVRTPPCPEPTRSPPAKRRASSAAGRSRAAPARKSSRTES
jgi:dolichol-phosphate mannosyltransferase